MGSRAVGIGASLLTLAGSAAVGCSASDSDGGGSAANGSGAGAVGTAGNVGTQSSAGVLNSAGGAADGSGGGQGGLSLGAPGAGGATVPSSGGTGGLSNGGTGGLSIAGSSPSAAGAGGAITGTGGASSGCAAACGANSKCEAATKSCVCNPSFISQAGVCSAAPVGAPSTHTQADVCTQWKQGHVITEPKPLTASGAECEPGTLKAGGISDTLVRINMFRWLEGMGPVSDDAQYDTDAQACANLEAWWDFKSTLSPHMPPASSKCYTTTGASTAGQSNISWGSNGPAQSIDQYMEDKGNDTTLGHRRWIVNPPLNPIGIGYWQTGGTYGNASCLRIFATKGTGPKPAWNAVPPAGFAPIEMAKYPQWSFEGSLAGIAKASASVLRVEDNMPLTVTPQPLSQGYGQDTMSFKPSGWVAEAGKTYRVTISGLTAGNIVYEVKPISCN